MVYVTNKGSGQPGHMPSLIHCKSLEYSMTVKLLTEHHLEFLSEKRGCTGSSESTYYVKIPHCWKSHVAAHILFKLTAILCNCIFSWITALFVIITLAATCEKLASDVSEQQRCRPACPSMQSDQHLYYSLIGNYYI